jgi:lipopolysaccharide export LptBFGC system permease protein LptF
MDIIAKKEMGFIEFMSLISYLIPDLLGIILPTAFAISCALLLIRLRETNQLTVIQSVGVPISRVALSVMKVGICVVTFMYLINFYFAPYALRQFKTVQFHVGQDIGKLFSKNNKLSFEGKIAVFIKKVCNNEFQGIAVFDQRASRKQIVLQAKRGHLCRQGLKNKLVLENGEGISWDLDSGTATRFRFKHYESDISEKAIANISARELKVYERYIYELFDRNLFGSNGFFEKKMQAEAHQRIVSPWLAIVFALICFWVVTTQKSFRHRSFKNFITAGACIIAVQGFNLAAFNLSHKYWEFNIVNYVGIIAVLILFVLLIFGPSLKKWESG